MESLSPVAPPLGAFTTIHSAALSNSDKRQFVSPQDLPHAPDIFLDAKKYKQLAFAQDLVRLFSSLHIVFPASTPTSLNIHKVSGSLTNAVFFVSHGTRTVLLRIYGPSSSDLISRPHELHVLHVLSSQYGIGPRVYGTFQNGRLEEYFASEALTPKEMRDPGISRWIAMRMAELHSVDLAAVDPDSREHAPVAVWRNVASWLAPARKVVRLARQKGEALGGRSAAMAAILDAIDLDRFEVEWQEYFAWLMDWERDHGRTERVFAHNDTQYGNLLRLKKLRSGEPAHHTIIVVDFEYAAPNSAAFDIANHFHEWSADYHSDAAHELRPERYPDLNQRMNFYRAYLGQGDENMCAALERSVRAWSPASHGMWAVWGIVQALEEVESASEQAGRRADEGPGGGANEGAGKGTSEVGFKAASGDIASGGAADSDAASINTVRDGVLTARDAQSETAPFSYLLYALSRVLLFRKEISYGRT